MGVYSNRKISEGSSQFRICAVSFLTGWYQDKSKFGAFPPKVSDDFKISVKNMVFWKILIGYYQVIDMI